MIGFDRFRAWLTHTVKEEKARVAETPDEDPRTESGWSPEDGAGYIPTEERSACPRCGQRSRSLCDDCLNEAEVSYK